MSEAMNDVTTVEPGTYKELNYFDDDIELLNKIHKGTRGRVIIIDNATQKDIEVEAFSLMALDPYETELTHDRLIERVNELHQHDWVLLMASFDAAQAWRQLLGRVLYKQMEHFRNRPT
jgi:hypothetical protein